ncbi:MAG: hypothetical protein L0Y56_03585, partial [Nitrospira sp.]|nr:hypothetical protein [Nitrospira sp.]
MEAILAICTVLGGIAAFWFIMDKARTIDWKRPTFRVRKNQTRIVGDQRIATETTFSEQESWPPGEEPNFPAEVSHTIEKLLPEMRLPTA